MRGTILTLLELRLKKRNRKTQYKIGPSTQTQLCQLMPLPEAILISDKIDVHGGSFNICGLYIDDYEIILESRIFTFL